MLTLLARRRRRLEARDQDSSPTERPLDPDRRAQALCLGLAVVLLGLLAHSTTSCERLVEDPVEAVTEDAPAPPTHDAVGALPLDR